MIEVHGVYHDIRNQAILRDISLSLPRGGVTALIGPNGAGKSTLLSLIARLQPVQRGRITIDDLRVGQCSDRDLAQTLAIMPQASAISARLRVGELVSMGRYPWHRGRPGAQDRDIVETTLDQFDLTALRNRFLDEVSGGQRQRALVAMACAQGTDYLLLDEPLNNLDIAASRHLMKLLQLMARDQGKSVVIVLHDINYAAGFADRLIVMAKGRIVADGPPAQVVTPDLLTGVFGTDAQVSIINGRPVVLV